MADRVIDAERFLQRFATMAEIGATSAGGVHRLAASATDAAARDQLRAWFDSFGMRTMIDPIGNMFGILQLAGDDAPLVMAGSHLDSQPQGGRFDGALGVVAACEAADTLRHATSRGRLRACCNLAVANWTNEEGARFQPSLLGSSMFAGAIDPGEALAQRDADGIDLAAALDAIGYRGAERPPNPAAYLELHIECGPLLDQAGGHLGLFSGYWGAFKHRVAFLGTQAHTGPTPMAVRKDALLGAAYLMVALREMVEQAPGVLHSSVGRIEVSPNSPNVVPAEAVLFVELRSDDPAVLNWADGQLMTVANLAAERAKTKLEWRGTERRQAGNFDSSLSKLCAAEAAAVAVSPHALAPRILSTVPGHDAISLSTICPTAMLVVPSVGGICHHPDEFTEDTDMVLGTEVLTRVLWRLCEKGGRP